MPAPDADGFIPVTRSSNVSGFRYIAAESRLDVRFIGGAIYSYHDVPEVVYDSMFDCNSFGSFVFQNLRGKYPYSRLA